MNTQILIEETVDLEDAIQIFDQDLIKEHLPQVQTTDDVTKTLVHEKTGESIAFLDSHLNHHIDPTYQ